MGLPKYSEIVEKLQTGIYIVEHMSKGNWKTSYVTMNPDIARINGFDGYVLTPRRMEEDRKLNKITVCNLQDKKYERIDLNPGKTRSLKRFKGKLVPSRIKGYNIIQVSYDEILTMLIRGKITIKYINKDNSEIILTVTRNPHIIKTLGGGVKFDSLVEDKRKGLISVYDCEKKSKRVINYMTIVELLGYEGPEDSQVKVSRVIYIDNKVQGAEFNIMGDTVTMSLEDTFTLISMGICTNARIDRNKITYSSVVPRVEFNPQPFTDIDSVKEIIRDKVYYITTGQVNGDKKIIQQKKHKDISKLVELLNTEYGYNIPEGVTQVQIEFK